MSPESEPRIGSVENVCVPVQVLALPRLMPSVLPAVVSVELFERESDGDDAPMTTGLDENESAPLVVTVVVPTPYTPAPPFDTRRFDDDGWVVVARPVQEIAFADRESGALKVSGLSYDPATCAPIV